MKGTSRRTLLKWMGAAAATAPLWSRRRPAEAQSAVRPRRMLLLFTPHGAPAEYFWPQSATNLASSAPNDCSILTPLAKHAAQLSVLRGLDYVGSSNHPAIHDVFTNHTPDSVDTVVARKLNVKPLRLGVVPDYTQSFTTDGSLAFEGGTARQHNPDPAAVFDALVAGLPPDTGSSTPPPAPVGPSAAELRRRALAVTDAELSALAARLGSSPLAARLQPHQSAIASLRGVAAPSAPSQPIVGCTGKPTLPSVERVRGKNVWAADGFADVLSAQLDLAAFALRCGLTRVVSIQCGYVNYQVPFSWLGFTEGHHELSHNSPGAPGRIKHAKCQQWFATQLALLLDQLAVPDPEDPAHTVLDNTVVLWASELADGQEHNCESVPIVLAGGGSGYLKPGQYVQYNGRSHAGLLLTLCEAMGVTGVDFGTGSTGGSLAEVRA